MSNEQWTPAELADLAAAYPEHVTTIGGRAVALVSRAELRALAASHPTMFRGGASQASLTEAAGEDAAADAALARRYPTTPRR